MRLLWENGGTRYGEISILARAQGFAWEVSGLGYVFNDSRAVCAARTRMTSGKHSLPSPSRCCGPQAESQARAPRVTRCGDVYNMMRVRRDDDPMRGVTTV